MATRADVRAKRDAASRKRDTENRKWRTIVVDPPWRYNDLGGAHGTAKQYGTMTLCELLALPLGQWAEPDAHLYVWTTNHFVREAVDLAEGWGFDLKTMLTWVKHREDQRWLGMGRYYRNATEHVVFAARGKAPILRHDLSTVFHAPRGRHSAKPQAFYDMVETASPGPYLDVFARKQRMGWDVAGNEVYSVIPELAAK